MVAALGLMADLTLGGPGSTIFCHFNKFAVPMMEEDLTGIGVDA
jgi:hypothetical protein